MVVLAQFTGFIVCVPLTGDLTPQGEEENAQTHQTQEHCPGQRRKLLFNILMLKLLRCLNKD